MDLDLTLSPKQHLVMNMAMQQALYVLQLSVEELANWLEKEIEANPLLELQEKKSLSKHIAPPSSISLIDPPCPCSLYEHLKVQLMLGFEEAKERKVAEQILESMDNQGFCSLEADQLDPELQPFFAGVKQKIQHLEPLGVGSKDTREYLLFQLENQGKKRGIAYEILDQHFSLFLQGESTSLARILKCDVPDVKKVIHEEIRPLHLIPARGFESSFSSQIVPDLILEYRDERWRLLVNEEILPSFQVNRLYQKERDLETRAYLSEKKRRVRWLSLACNQRRKTLEKVGKVILQRQLPFFSLDGSGLLSPLTCRQVADAIGMHESTVTRAIKGKWLSSPSGMFPLSLFFKSGVETEKEGAVSSHSIKELLQAILAKEAKPLSDAALLKELQKRGIKCARRTVAKYRSSLLIPSSIRR